MTFWVARDVYRVQRCFRGLLLLVFLLELSMEVHAGTWYIGVVLIAVQYALLRGLGWLLRWGYRASCRGLRWGLTCVTQAVVGWWHGTHDFVPPGRVPGEGQETKPA
jgi:hypothetical protein